MKASISAARRSASSPICAPTACSCRPRRSAQTRRLIETRVRRELPAGRAAHLHDARPRTRRRRTRRSARPTCSARPQDVARLSRQRPAAALRADLEAHRREPDGERPCSTRSRSTSPRRTGKRAAARHRLGRAVRRLPHALRRGPGRRRRGRGRQPPPARRRGATRRSTAATSRRSSISPSRRRAIPRRAWSRSSRSSASAGPRPMPRSSRCCRTATMCGSTASASFPRIAAASSPPSSTSFFARYVEYNFTADLEDQLDDISGGTHRLEDRCCASSGSDFSAAVGETKDLRDHARCSTRSTRSSARISSRRRRRRQDPRALPGLRRRPARPEARQVRRLHRLLELSGVPLHAHRWRIDDGDGEMAARRHARRARAMLGIDPVTGKPVTAAQGPLRPLRPARRRRRGQGEAQARVAAQGHDARRDHARDGAGAAGAAARARRRIPRTASRSSPASAASGPTSSTARPLQVARGGRDVLTIGLNRAVRAAGRGQEGRAGAAPTPLRVLGNHPDDGAPVDLFSGRYGPYVKHGGVNATVPRDLEPEAADARAGGRIAARPRAAAAARARAASKEKQQGCGRAKGFGQPEGHEEERTGQPAKAGARKKRQANATPEAAE